MSIENMILHAIENKTSNKHSENVDESENDHVTNDDFIEEKEETKVDEASKQDNKDNFFLTQVLDSRVTAIAKNRATKLSSRKVSLKLKP